MPNSEQGSQRNLRDRIQRARVLIHQKATPATHYCESACAVGYAVHEVFHWTHLLVPTAYGLLIVIILRVITMGKAGF